MSNVKVGEVVHLKSDSNVQMVVESVEVDATGRVTRWLIHTVWLSRDGYRQSGVFAAELLKEN